jgi:hypothetical protein
MSGYVSAELRRALLAAAGWRCGYCQTSELISGAPLEVDHLTPQSRGGLTVEQNLWLACRACNASKSDRQNAIDPVSGALVPLFNPRTNIWSEHFAWSAEGILMAGITSIGRATIHALDLNRVSLVVARSTWVRHGLHPPTP